MEDVEMPHEGHYQPLCYLHNMGILIDPIKMIVQLYLKNRIREFSFYFVNPIPESRPLDCG